MAGSDLAHAQRLAKLIAGTREFELMAPIELSAVCFRYRGVQDASDETLNRRNAAILGRVVERGRVYLPLEDLAGHNVTLE